MRDILDLQSYLESGLDLTANLFGLSYESFMFHSPAFPCHIFLWFPLGKKKLTGFYIVFLSLYMDFSAFFLEWHWQNDFLN